MVSEMNRHESSKWRRKMNRGKVFASLCVGLIFFPWLAVAGSVSPKN